MASEGMHSPVEQFEIRPIIELAAGGYDISFTNSSLFMLLAMVVGGGFLFAAMRNRELVPGRMQGAAEGRARRGRRLPRARGPDMHA